MGGHPAFFARLTRSLEATNDPARQDEILDSWNEAAHLATNWDADRWGLDPDDPMWQEGA